MGAEDGSTRRPHTDPRLPMNASSSAGPDLEGLVTIAIRPPEAAAEALVDRVPLTLETAREQVATAALRADAAVGQVGLELESHVVDLREPGARPDWQRTLEAVAAIPERPGKSLVTLEPGGQIELSSPPSPSIGEAVHGLWRDRQLLAVSLRMKGLGSAALGTDPARPVRRTNPGDRYAAMEAHFRSGGMGGAGTAMMCSTASLQLNLDAGPEVGWADRVGLAHALGPTMIAISACSPLLAGRRTGWASSRQRIWDELDADRCGPALGGADPAGEWAAYALMAPVMLVRSEAGGAEPVTERVTFAAWVSDEVRLGGRPPSARDLDYHLTTLFPPVRLRGFLEIRYLDATPERWWPAIAATLATLLDHPLAADEAAEAVRPVARSWSLAARDGLSDPALHAAAVRLLAIANTHADLTVRPDIERLATLVEQGRSPGAELLEHAAHHGPLAVLLDEAQR